MSVFGTPLGFNLTNEDDPVVNSPYNTNFEEGVLSPPPPAGFFLLLDGTIFKLLDGEDLTLL